MSEKKKVGLDIARSSTLVQAFVWDDANQPVPAAGKPNLQARILPIGAAQGGLAP